MSKTEQSNVRVVTAEQENFSPLLSTCHEQNIDYMLSMIPEHDDIGVEYYSADDNYSPEPSGPSPLHAVRTICQEGEMPSTWWGRTSVSSS